MSILRSEELEPLTPNAITDPERLKEGLEKARDQGFATDNRELHEAICVTAPVKYYRGEVTAAVSMSVLASRFSDEKSKKLI